MGYPFSLVLHTHLPMVVNHGRWPHGSDWLNEAAFECYLPLLETAHRLVAEGISPKWTLNSRRCCRAARLPRIPEGAGVLLRERPARLRGEPRALHAGGPRRRSSASRTSGKISTSACGSCTGGSAATSPARSPSCSGPATGDHHVRGHARLPAAAVAATSPSTCSSAPRSRRTGATSAGAAGDLAAGVRLSPALRVDAADRPPTAAAPAHAARASRRCWPPRPRVLRGRLAPGRRRRAALPLHATTSPLREHARDGPPRPLPVRARRAPRMRPTASPPAEAPAARGLLPRSADDAPGVEPRARLPGRLRLPRVPQEALPGRASLLAHHRHVQRSRQQAGLRPEDRRREARACRPATSSSWCRRPLDHAGGRRPRARVLALRLRAVRPLVVRGAALARAVAREMAGRRARA